MKKDHFKILVPSLFAATALALAVSAGAQTPPPPGPSPAAKSPQAAPMTGHHKESAAKAKHDADMKTECQAMMAKKQEMQDKLQAMDATLDKLVAEMNTAKGSKEVDAMEKPMAAVINELVAQRKAAHSMMMQMQPAMMAHMTTHMNMHGTKGAMECPMMKTGNAPEAKAEDKKPKM
jgi:Skp family chaperone for outer membrane proteins